MFSSPPSPPRPKFIDDDGTVSYDDDAARAEAAYLKAQEDRGADQARAAEPTGANTGASLAQTAEKPLG
jgi:hypothetical protein